MDVDQNQELTIDLTGWRLAWLVAGLAAGALMLLVLSGALPLPALPNLDASTSLWLVALTGLSVGGVSCLAVQGGLLASTVAQRAKSLAARADIAGDVAGAGAAGGSPSPLARALPVVQFQLAKLAAYTALGAVLGAFGAQMTSRVQGMTMLAAAAFMVVVALQQYDAHPALRRIAFQPPKRAQRAIRAFTRRGDALGPWLLGAATVLIPCGVTLAMEGLAIASRSAVRGAAIMGVFTLGTAPLFLALGMFATGLSGAAYRLFKPLAAAALVVVAALTFQGGLRLMGIIGAPTAGPVVEARAGGASEVSAAQSITIRAVQGAYVPDAVRIKAGVPTQLTLATEGTTGCTRAFTIPGLGIQAMLPVTGQTVLSLPPLHAGTLPFVCSMGMYGGVIEVIP